MEDLVNPKLVYNTIPEVVFVDRILPLVRAALKEGKADLTRWLELSGGPLNPIHVVDNNNREKLLFIVPPVWAQIEPRIPAHQRDSYGDVAIQSQLKSDIIPVIGQRYWDNRMAQKLDGVHTTRDASAWDVIFKRYGINLDSFAEPGEIKPVATPPPTPAAASVSGLFSDELDDL